MTSSQRQRGGGSDDRWGWLAVCLFFIGFPAAIWLLHELSESLILPPVERVVRHLAPWAVEWALVAIAVKIAVIVGGLALLGGGLIGLPSRGYVQWRRERLGEAPPLPPRCLHPRMIWNEQRQAMVCSACDHAIPFEELGPAAQHTLNRQRRRRRE